MVFELLGPNLEDLFRFCDNRFSMKTTLMLLDQLLRRVENLHAAGHHHRDIKPENFLLGTGRRGHLVYMTDLGLASHRPPGDRRVVGPGATKPPRLSLTGTCRYASINGHMDVGKLRHSILCHTPLIHRRAAASCRDDLESLGYMAIYFLRGSLPWQGLQGSTRQEKYERVLEQKQKTGVDELCRDLPAEFATYMNYLRQMRDADAPDYAYLRKLFGGLFRRLGYAHDNVFDWTIREFGRLATTSQQATIENAKRGKKPAATKRRKGKAPGRRRRARNNPEPV
jgi:serine/threonine protein kinase